MASADIVGCCRRGLLLRPCLQLSIGVLWSLTSLLASPAEDIEGGSALGVEEVGERLLTVHPLLLYLVGAGLGCAAVWLALE